MPSVRRVLAAAALLVAPVAASAQSPLRANAVWDSYGILKEFTRLADGYSPAIRDVWYISDGVRSYALDTFGGALAPGAVFGGRGAVNEGQFQALLYDGVKPWAGITLFRLPSNQTGAGLARTSIAVRNLTREVAYISLTRAISVVDQPELGTVYTSFGAGLRPGYWDVFRTGVSIPKVGETGEALNRFTGAWNHNTDIQTLGDPATDRMIQLSAWRAIPEPGTWALLGTGLLGLGAVARRRLA